MAKEIEIIQNFTAKHHIRAIRYLEHKDKLKINSYTSLDFITQMIDVIRRERTVSELLDNLSNLTKSCSRYGSEIFCRRDISANDASSPASKKAKSARATIPYRPFVESFMSNHTFMGLVMPISLKLIDLGRSVA